MDEKLIFSIIDRFEASSLTALAYHNGAQTLKLKKGTDTVAPVASKPAEIASRTAQAASAERTTQAVSPQEPASAKSTDHDVITSPIVATFYSSNMPDAPPFVNVGDTVKKGQTLCILEAMKMMNKLDAEADCEILAVKVKPGDLVEFGQVLFEIKKR
jgi:acetyl-CoA carboxylase biotin carboxyl carrier protein